jgi:hypothetical protein
MPATPPRRSVLGQVATGQRDDRWLVLPGSGPDRASRPQSVEVGHLHVHQDDVVRRPGDGLHRLEPVAHDVDAVAQPAQEQEGDPLVDRVVLGEEHVERRARSDAAIRLSSRVLTHRRPSWPVPSHRRWSSSGSSLPRRDAHGERIGTAGTELRSGRRRSVSVLPAAPTFRRRSARRARRRRRSSMASSTTRCRVGPRSGPEPLGPLRP